MRAILMRLELLSFGSVQAWNPSGGRSGEPDDRFVSLVLRADEPPHLHYRARYDGAKSDGGRERVIDAAQAELESWSRRTAPVPAETRPLDKLILEDGAGWEAELVARRFGVDPAFVRRVRQRANLGSDDGCPVVPMDGMDIAEKRRHAQELKARGLSQRQIGLHLGVDAKTVRKYLSAA